MVLCWSGSGKRGKRLYHPKEKLGVVTWKALPGQMVEWYNRTGL